MLKRFLSRGGFLVAVLLCASGAGAQTFSGKYDSSAGEDIRTLEILKLEDDSYRFHLLVKKPGCAGEIEGIAMFSNQDELGYSGEDCQKLLLKLQGKQIVVSEENCLFHGALCDFAGTYTQLKE